MTSCPLAILEKEKENKWNSLCESADNKGIILPDDPAFTDSLKHIMTLSDFISRSFIRAPQLLHDLFVTGDLNSSYTKDQYKKKLSYNLSRFPVNNNETEFSMVVRRFRLREMLRIAWRDILSVADFYETVQDLSNLADCIIDTVISFLYKQQSMKSGIPTDKNGKEQHLAVFGMGKLGGQELNFSSDVDIIFAYPEKGTTQGSKNITNQMFFTNLCKSIIRIIGSSSPDGTIFRVDTELRPFGNSGPIVMDFDAMEHYYQTQGREWERYAWIKARGIAGAKQDADMFIDRLTPFVYRKYLDFGVFDALRMMKHKISLETENKTSLANVKLGPGGIREVEFFVHVFQLTRGGIDIALQEPNLLKALNILSSRGYVSHETHNELKEGYIFLRNVEHRLQEFSDQQTHVLPKDDIAKYCLAISMGFDDWESFEKQLLLHMTCIHKHFDDLLATKRHSTSNYDNNSGLETVWYNTELNEDTKKILAEAGFDDPASVIAILDNLKNAPQTKAISSEGKARIDRLLPILLKEIAKKKDSSLVLNRIAELIKTIERRTNYLSLFLENRDTIVHLVNLASASPWIISYLAKHPVLLDELIDPRTLYTPPDKKELEKDIYQRLDHDPDKDDESQITNLNIFKHSNILRIAAADISNAVPLMKVSDHLTDVAEVVLDKVFDLAWSHMIHRHGKPQKTTKHNKFNEELTDYLLQPPVFPSQKPRTNFIVIAYGKLGGIELGYGSDLDLVFLHEGNIGKTTDGERPIDETAFFARLGQRIIHILTVNTSAGKLYDVDMRLRPNGRSGTLVANIDAFRTYQEKNAWTWEHQALVRARPVCGDPELIRLFQRIRFNVLSRQRHAKKLSDDIKGMRERMRKEMKRSVNGMFDLKQGIGGIVDIEFLVQYLVLLNAHKHHDLVKWTDNIRIIETLVTQGVINKNEGSILKKAYITLRSKIHRMTLQNKPPLVHENEFHELRKAVTEIWKYLFESTGTVTSGE